MFWKLQLTMLKQLIPTGKLWTFHAPRLFHATPLIKKFTVFLAPHLFHAPCLFDIQEY